MKSSNYMLLAAVALARGEDLMAPAAILQTLIDEFGEDLVFDSANPLEFDDEDLGQDIYFEDDDQDFVWESDNPEIGNDLVFDDDDGFVDFEDEDVGNDMEIYWDQFNYEDVESDDRGEDLVDFDDDDQFWESDNPEVGNDLVFDDDDWFGDFEDEDVGNDMEVFQDEFNFEDFDTDDLGMDLDFDDDSDNFELGMDEDSFDMDALDEDEMGSDLAWPEFDSDDTGLDLNFEEWLDSDETGLDLSFSSSSEDFFVDADEDFWLDSDETGFDLEDFDAEDIGESRQWMTPSGKKTSYPSTTMCPQDVRKCPYGSAKEYVSRKGPNCQWESCGKKPSQPNGWWWCKNRREKIQSKYLCDGAFDCTDKSDESSYMCRGKRNGGGYGSNKKY